MSKLFSMINEQGEDLILSMHNHRRFYTSYSYGSNDCLKWILYRDSFKEEEVPSHSNLILNGYRKCCNNDERFLFINLLIDEEREILVRSLNNSEFGCFIKIIGKVKVVDDFEEFIKSKYEPKLIKVDYVKKKSEILVNNMLKEVEIVKEVRIYE